MNAGYWHKTAATFLSSLICLFCSAVPLSAESGEKLIVFHAGSLSIPFREMSDAFSRRYPGVQVIREAAGSRTCARKITELGRACDVMASADYTVIERLLIPDYASWNISFATNEMAIMYRPDSKYAGEINGQNWYRILLKKDVTYGHSDPNSDPCGYRSQLVWQLAEKYYHVPDLYEKLKAGCPVRNVRPKETDLIALLEAGQIDYLFIYKSVCMQHGMRFVGLPENINLGSSTYADFYAQAKVRISGKTPGSFIEKTGKPMVYGLTIPDNAPHRVRAIQFVSFVLGPEGREIMKRNGQRPIAAPMATGHVTRMPPSLKRLVK
ncbi:MAG: tungstate ABC transporter substrate-binding protein WtpA [Deltaproteobacteria bacterium]|nr:MAG: tungstate ABC transporter substrate-binding protein WtpA [Deltaproteobacteria bacterium]